MADILVTKYVDDYSPELFINCADGSIFYEVTITLTDPEYSDSDLEHPTGNYLEIKLEDVTVTSYMFIGETGAEPPKESFTLGYSTIKYTVQLVDRTWDLEKNREL
jgi:type VI protein secretion system component Hcp